MGPEDGNTTVSSFNRSWDSIKSVFGVKATDSWELRTGLRSRGWKETHYSQWDRTEIGLRSDQSNLSHWVGESVEGRWLRWTSERRLRGVKEHKLYLVLERGDNVLE